MTQKIVTLILLSTLGAAAAPTPAAVSDTLKRVLVIAKSPTNDGAELLGLPATICWSGCPTWPPHEPGKTP